MNRELFFFEIHNIVLVWYPFPWQFPKEHAVELEKVVMYRFSKYLQVDIM